MSRRTEKAASIIQRVIGDAILHHLHDPRISTLTSVTKVQLTGDFKYADVWISVMGNQGQQATTLNGLKHAHGFLQSAVARGLSTRQCPTLRFKLDDSIKQGIETMRLINQAMQEISESSDQAASDEESDASSPADPGAQE